MSKTQISTLVTIAPRGMSFHGHSLRRDLLGSPCRPEQDVCNCAECTPPGQEDQSARLAASAEVGQVEGTNALEQFQRWLETKAHKSSALIQATEPRLCFAQDVYLDESLVIAECRVATKLLMQFKLEQGQ